MITPFPWEIDGIISHLRTRRGVNTLVLYNIDGIRALHAEWVTDKDDRVALSKFVDKRSKLITMRETVRY